MVLRWSYNIYTKHIYTGCFCSLFAAAVGCVFPCVSFVCWCCLVAGCVVWCSKCSIFCFFWCGSGLFVPPVVFAFVFLFGGCFCGQVGCFSSSLPLPYFLCILAPSPGTSLTISSTSLCSGLPHNKKYKALTFKL
jgi:hypothetical protein